MQKHCYVWGGINGSRAACFPCFRWKDHGTGMEPYEPYGKLRACFGTAHQSQHLMGCWVFLFVLSVIGFSVCCWTKLVSPKSVHQPVPAPKEPTVPIPTPEPQTWLNSRLLHSIPFSIPFPKSIVLKTQWEKYHCHACMLVLILLSKHQNKAVLLLLGGGAGSSPTGPQSLRLQTAVS